MKNLCTFRYLLNSSLDENLSDPVCKFQQTRLPERKTAGFFTRLWSNEREITARTAFFDFVKVKKQQSLRSIRLVNTGKVIFVGMAICSRRVICLARDGDHASNPINDAMMFWEPIKLERRE